MSVSPPILALTLILAVGNAVIVPCGTVVARAIVENTGDRSFSHHPRFLLTRAFTLALSLEGNDYGGKRARIRLLGEIAQGAIDMKLWQTNLFEDIMAAIDAIELENYERENKEIAFGNIAQKFYEIGELELALELIDKAHPVGKTQFFEERAKFWFEKGDRNRGIESLLQATESAKEIDDLVMGTTYCHNDRSDVLKKFAIKFAELGEIDLAFDVVRAITPCGGLYPGTLDYAPSKALLEIFAYVRNPSEFKETLAIVESFTTIPDKAKALGKLIPQLTDPEDFQTVLRIISTLEKTRFESWTIENRGPISLVLVQRWIELGQIEKAIAFSEQIKSLSYQTSAFIEIARYFSERRDEDAELWLDKAIARSEKIGDISSQVSVFFEIVRYLSENNDDRADIWLERILDRSRFADPSYQRTNILPGVISVWLEAGQIEKAIELLRSSESDLSLNHVRYFLFEKEQVDLSVEFSLRFTNADLDPAKKILMLVDTAERFMTKSNSRNTYEREQAQKVEELLRKAMNEFSHHFHNLESSQILEISSNILSTEWGAIIYGEKIFLGTKTNILDTKHYEFLYSILQPIDESSKLKTIQRIAFRLDSAGETDRAFEIMESIRLEEDYKSNSNIASSLIQFFFDKLDSDCYISEEQKRDYLEIAFAYFREENEVYSGEKIAALALELEKVKQFVSAIAFAEESFRKDNALISLIQGNEKDSLSVLEAMKNFLDSSINADILTRVIPTLQAEKELELALEMIAIPSKRHFDRPKLVSAIAIRFAELGNIDRAVELANAIADIELKALTLVKISTATYPSS